VITAGELDNTDLGKTVTIRDEQHVSRPVTSAPWMVRGVLSQVTHRMEMGEGGDDVFTTVVTVLLGDDRQPATFAVRPTDLVEATDPPSFLRSRAF
jgi:hypothetical protein